MQKHLGLIMREYPKHLPLYIENISKDIVRKTAFCSTVEDLVFIQGLIFSHIEKPHNDIVPIYDFTIKHCKKYRYDYSYDMKRMYSISTIERSLIDHVGNGYSFGIDDPLHKNKSPDIQNTLEMGWKEYPKLMQLLERMLYETKYFDIHGGNIMVNPDDERYQIIDIEGFIYTPIKSKTNDWIRGLRTGPIDQRSLNRVF